MLIFKKEGIIMDSEQICPDCGVEFVNGVCPKCSLVINGKESVSKGAVHNTTVGWGGTTQQSSSKKHSSGGFCNG